MGINFSLRIFNPGSFARPGLGSSKPLQSMELLPSSWKMPLDVLPRLCSLGQDQEFPRRPLSWVGIGQSPGLS